MEIAKEYPQTIKKRKLHLYFGIFATIATLWTLIYSIIICRFGWAYADIKGTKPTFGSGVPIENYFHYYSWLFFFTNISNLMFAVVTLTRGITNSNRIFSDKAQVVVCSYMLLVGIVYWTAIGAEDLKTRIETNLTSFFAPNYLFFWLLNNLLIHLATVICATTLALIGIKEKTKVFPLAFYVLIFPFTYYLFAWMVYLITWKVYDEPGYIYRFWDFFHPFGKTESVIGAIGIGLVFFVGLILLFFIIFFILVRGWSRKSVITSSTKIETQKVVLPTTEYNKNIKTPKTLNTKRKIVGSKKARKAVYTKLASSAKIHYFIQKSTKANGWELKLKGGAKATYVGSTKQAVEDYYHKHLKRENTLVIVKSQHGQIKKVSKKR